MAVSIETARREMCGALIDILKLRAAPFLEEVQRAQTLLELRQLIFLIMDDVRPASPDNARKLLEAWDALDDL